MPRPSHDGERNTFVHMRSSAIPHHHHRAGPASSNRASEWQIVVQSSLPGTTTRTTATMNGSMNESCIGLREQRLHDTSSVVARAVPALLGGGVSPPCGHPDEETASSTAAESVGGGKGLGGEFDPRELEVAAVSLCEHVLEELEEDSVFFEKVPARPIAMFHEEEIHIGSVLGQGEFGTVREVQEVSLSQRHLFRKDSSRLNLFDESYTKKGEDGGLSKMDRDRLTVRELSFREGKARYAIKRVREDLVGKDRVMAALDLAVEARFLASLTHPNIIRMRGAAGQPGGPSFMVIMDRLYQTLEQKIEQWRAEEVLEQRGCIGIWKKPQRVWSNEVLERMVMAYDISRALNFLHEHRVIYRDLKPQNIGCDVRGHVKLFDLGLARELKATALVKGDLYDLTPMTGTRRWMAPEVCLSLPYGLKADVFGFGLLLWHLITLDVPFGERISPDQHFKRVVKGGERPQIPRFVPNSMRQVLKSCWNANPDRRPKLGGVCLDLRSEISSIKEKQSSRSLLDRTEHLRLHSTRSLLKAWLALGLPMSSHRLVTKLGEPSSDLKPITENETTESFENAVLTRLQVPPSSAALPEGEWHDRYLFGSALECQMPSSWTDLSWQLSRVPESRELWQDGQGDDRQGSCYLLKVEVREPQVDLSAACFFYYQEAAHSNQVDDDRRKWSTAAHAWEAAPSDTVTAFGLGWLPLGQQGRSVVRMEQMVLRPLKHEESLELVVALFSGASDLPPASTPVSPSATFARYVKSLQLKDLNGLLGHA